MVVVLYLIINCQVSSWSDWTYPYQSVFFPVHFVAAIFDYVKARQWHYEHKKPLLTTQQVWTDQVLSFIMCFVDIVLLVNQGVFLKHNKSRATIAQIVLVAYVLTASLLRLGLAWSRQRLSGKGSSTASGEQSRLMRRTE